ncbi:acetyl-CoA carboxylase carboxyltransferase subunit alpha [Thermosyntropha lipolytica DSM 11003]|uniref:Acetyl-coenzyme A carboxylase carboxyl transferase subunit alpha n=1 Tax=Thermosyntropha lipolytica DSM 11003 TaxID=1123382 RepID=A0A1M5JCT7_9FIRM|nr:acetyl-CoA carboxylase carboxyltransferase subunit alpha [Thermosyntropha lipolytica]SHG38394.1 acetyl-CoA carboxylase carboxyltransferase subunit alpha [Thermosyntropha lipolytica DSM 11003]
MSKKFQFEEQHENLLNKLNELKNISASTGFNLDKEIKLLEAKIERLKEERYSNLSPWEKVVLSRQVDRPSCRQYIEEIFTDFVELHGDRTFGDDKAIIGGIAFFEGIPVTVVGHQKGKNTKENIERNFGMPHPEGFRKAKRLFLQAEKFRRPVITFIDTPGAYPGVGAEERGQAWAIAENLMLLSGLKVPIISIVIGEGGSGGALALAVGDKLFMLSNSVFSVASPEASASILWKSLDEVEKMAGALKLTADDLKAFGIIDDIIPEPVGGANQDLEETADIMKKCIREALEELLSLTSEELVKRRYERLRKMTVLKF